MTSSTQPSHEALELFRETADPARYVPREATEQALGALEAWRREEGVGSTVVALVAAPGLGKTLLLRLFEERLRRDGAASEAGDVLYLPYAGLELPDLCAWCYGLLGRGPAPAESRDHPLAALTGLVALAGGRIGRSSCWWTMRTRCPSRRPACWPRDSRASGPGCVSCSHSATTRGRVGCSRRSICCIRARSPCGRR